MHRHHMSCKME